MESEVPGEESRNSGITSFEEFLIYTHFVHVNVH